MSFGFGGVILGFQSNRVEGLVTDLVQWGWKGLRISVVGI